MKVNSIFGDICWFIRYRIIEWFLDIPHKLINWKLKRKRGWSKYDTYEFKWVISDILAKGLKAFKEDIDCHPPEMTFEEWQGIIQEMVDGFTIAVNEEDYCCRDEYKKKSKLLHRSLKLFEKYFDDLWW